MQGCAAGHFMRMAHGMVPGPLTLRELCTAGPRLPIEKSAHFTMRRAMITGLSPYSTRRGIQPRGTPDQSIIKIM